MIRDFLKTLFIIAPSFLKIIFYKMKGAKIGNGFRLGYKSFISINDYKNINIGEDVKIGNNVRIYSDRLSIGHETIIHNHIEIIAKQNVSIGNECIIYDYVTIGGGQQHDSSFFAGNNVHIFQYCFLNTTKPLILEDGVGIGGGTYIFTHGSWQDAYDGYPFSFAPVVIKKNAWLPWRVFVMPGIVIGENATIGSDALITKNIPDNSFAVGVPAKVLKTGHEYVKKMDQNQKFELMKEIFMAYKNKAHEFFNINYDFIESENKLELRSSKNKIVYSLNSNYENDENTLLLTELEQDVDIKPNVFDLRNKKCRWPLDETASNVKSFLTFYGIRLMKIGKYE